MQLIFEKSREGRRGVSLPLCDVPDATMDIPDGMRREMAPSLPQVAEVDMVRHFVELSSRVFGVDKGFYPLGSCTMKYNPKIHEDLANLPGFTEIHPLQPGETVQGALQLLDEYKNLLCSLTGMDAMTLSPAAGSHGEWAGLQLIRSYHLDNGEPQRTKVLVPDSAHGTNPANAAIAGFDVVNVKSYPDGTVDLQALRDAVGEDTAALMLTNPNTIGIFEKNILEIAAIVHEAGGLLYYDGANMNAIMGVVRPGDMGFDVVHLNVHKTLSTPHGGGGPGSGPVGCKAMLAPFLPNPQVLVNEDGFTLETLPEAFGRIKAFYGNFLVEIKAYCYMLSLGAQGLLEASQNAVLNANYMRYALSDAYDVAYPGICMHEFVLSAEGLKEQYGITAMDIAKNLLDQGIHPPTVYFPLIVPEALMFEPTETESKETLDRAVEVLLDIRAKAESSPDALHAAPMTTPAGRLDETMAARNPVLRYTFAE
ncbi:aminomethyl-transferring glycine dehydrogenase subunit GcvPB [Eubacteriales bacterium OttesenSCG-928-M02]|nr:aminomethyl-transferring glycine dehydrogenase subunit GcvPB [Eubacteriales bacterium OttesenSCG-928-M02]